MNESDATVRVRTWDPGIPGAVLSLGPEGLLRADMMKDAPFSEPDIVDPAVPSSLEGSRAAVGHRRLAELVHACFGPNSGISRSPSSFRRSIQAIYGARYGGGRLLDVGCGDPIHLTDWLGEAAEVTGLDLFAPTRVPPKATYSLIPLSGLYPVNSSHFDFSIGLFVLEHVLHLAQTLSETSRALRLGGTAVWVTTLSLNEGEAATSQPCLALGHWRDFSYLEQEGTPWIISLDTLVRQAEEVGFEVHLILGTRFGEGSDLRWREWAAGEPSDFEQVLLEMRKVA